MPVPALNNNAYFSVVGPQLLYWCPRNSAAFANALAGNYGGLAYLGTTVRSPEITDINAEEKVMNSLVGTMIPAEKSFQGKMCQIVCPMNRVSESSLRRLKSLPYYQGGGSSRAAQDAGSYTFQDLGSLSNQDGAAFMLVMLNSMAPPLAGGAPDIPLGVRFFCVTWPEGKQTDLVTVPKVDTLVFEANVSRGLTYTFGGTYFDMTYTIYDYEIASHATFVPPS